MEKKLLHVEIPKEMSRRKDYAELAKRTITLLREKFGDRYEIIVSPFCLTFTCEDPTVIIKIDASTDIDGVIQKLIEFGEKMEELPKDGEG